MIETPPRVSIAPKKPARDFGHLTLLIVLISIIRLAMNTPQIDTSESFAFLT